MQALSKRGTEPNRAGRSGVAAAMGRLLQDGERFTDPEADIDVEDLRGWAGRLGELARDLADCVEAPLRNRVLEMLASTSVPDDLSALTALRINIAGASYGQLGEEAGVSGRTVERIEEGNGCQVGVAFKLTKRFALRTTELFTLESWGDALLCRTVGELRTAMMDPDDLVET
jgi:DNA-binding XRE family transcriptional regulator